MASPARSALEPAQGAAPAPVAETDELADHDVVRLIKTGVVVGTPVVLIVLMVVGWLAVPGQPGVLVAVAWPALFAGWYFGTIAALAVHERRHQRQRPAGRPAAEPSPPAADTTEEPPPDVDQRAPRDTRVGAVGSR